MRITIPALGAVCLVIALALTGCSLGIAQPAPNTPAVVPSFTAIPTLTARPPGTVVASAAPSQAGGPGTTFSTVITADNVNLRTHPGTTFPVLRLLAKGTRVSVLGHAPGNEWLYIQSEPGVSGWVLYWLVNEGESRHSTPLVQPQDVQAVQGQVMDRAGVPVSGIGFAVTQGTGPKAPRTDGTTDETGHFYAFLPLDASGTWYVSYVSVACTSNTMDAKCNCIGACGKPDPEGYTVTLPVANSLQFVWK